MIRPFAPRPRAGRFASARRALACAAFVFASAARADPPWWKGEHPDAADFAIQTGRGVVLYFANDRARDCLRMDAETWPRLDPEVGEDLIWIRLDPNRDAEFFTYYKIFQVPAIVALDGLLREKIRLEGFVEPATLMDRLARIPRMMPTATTTHQGRVVLREEALRSSSGGVNVLNANPFRAEDFDGRASIASIDSKWFSIVRQSASRPIENEGRAGTTALMLDAGDRGESVLRFEISLGAERVEQIAGRIGVSLWSRGVAGEAGWSPGFLTVIGREESPDRSRAARVELPEIQAGSGWTQLRAVTPRMNFRLQRAFLTLRVEGAARRALVDDLRVDLLPYDTDEQLLEAVARRTPKTERRFEPTDHYLFQVYDKDGDGKIARSEVPEEAFRLFDRVDANADGVVTHEEALADLMRRFGRGDGIPPIAAR